MVIMETLRAGDLRLQIIHDEDACSPRDEYCDYESIMAIPRGKYDYLGDGSQHELCVEILSKRDDDGMNADEIEVWLNTRFGTVLPLYVYDHSGISIRTFRHGQHAGWDCSMVGWFVHPLADKEELLERELDTYDDYVTGNCYGYNLTRMETCDKGHEHEADEVGSCWGFLGDDYEKSGLMDYARSDGWPEEVSE